jgi:hypothetical protein
MTTETQTNNKNTHGNGNIYDNRNTNDNKIQRDNKITWGNRNTHANTGATGAPSHNQNYPLLHHAAYYPRQEQGPDHALEHGHVIKFGSC